MPSILQQANNPLMGYQGEIGTLLSKSNRPQLPQRPGIPQVNIKPPNFLGLQGAENAAEAQIGAANQGAAVQGGTALASALALALIIM